MPMVYNVIEPLGPPPRVFDDGRPQPELRPLHESRYEPPRPVANTVPQEPLGLPVLFAANDAAEPGDNANATPRYAGAAGYTPVANNERQEPLGLPQLFGDDV